MADANATVIDADSDIGIVIPNPSPRSKRLSDTPFHHAIRPDVNWYHLISVAFQDTLQEHASPTVLNAKPAAVHERWGQLCREKGLDTPRASAGDAGHDSLTDSNREVEGDVDMSIDDAEASSVATARAGGRPPRPRGRPRKHTSPAIAAAKCTLQQISDISDRQWSGPAGGDIAPRRSARSGSTRRRELSESPSQKVRPRGRPKKRKETTPAREDAGPAPAPQMPEKKQRTRGRSSNRREPISSDPPVPINEDAQAPAPAETVEPEPQERRITRSRSRKRRESTTAPAAEPVHTTDVPEHPPASPSPPRNPDSPVQSRHKPATPPRHLPPHLAKILFFFTILPKPGRKPAIARPLSFSFSYSFFRAPPTLAQQSRRKMSSDRLVMLCVLARVRKKDRVRTGRISGDPVLAAGPFLQRNLRAMQKRMEERRKKKAKRLAMETAAQEAAERDAATKAAEAGDDNVNAAESNSASAD
ncbi:hypothetical protein Dda_0843 [Drechslerella dactyloides]|uniref:Uncharacterized protein n=1 Tax=Drechslerella dactyloides TaxID=74499 RepID=A0AAD6J544_DREDA|nr:hypothetical protein Dda_0843 [Drechslerella dactyloides]